MTMTKQEIAKAIVDIDWVEAECDDPFLWDRIHYLREQLVTLPPDEIVRFFWKVMQAKECAAKHPEQMGGMLEFKYIDGN